MVELSVELVATLAAVVWALVQTVKGLLPPQLDPRGVATVITIVLAVLMQAGVLPAGIVHTAGLAVMAFLGPSAIHQFMYKPGLGGGDAGAGK